ASTMRSSRAEPLDGRRKAWDKSSSPIASEGGLEMALYDTLIRGGMVVDGTRMQRRRCDLAIKNGRVAKLGHIKPADADRVLDAGGMVVAPGFVDLHTHYDAQVFWDPYCTLSGWH